MNQIPPKNPRLGWFPSCTNTCASECYVETAGGVKVAARG